MPLLSAPYYWYECDICGNNSQWYTDYSAWEDIESAVEQAEYADWTISGDRQHAWCWDHKPCENCGKQMEPYFGERDYMCEACWYEQNPEQKPEIIKDTHP